jgi:hypothetical protein
LKVAQLCGRTWDERLMTSEAKSFLRNRRTTRRLMITVVIIGFILLPARCIWTMKGGDLPSLSELRNGMTEDEVKSIVGYPSSKGDRPDGTTWWVITRSGSLYWVELDFDAEGRLRAFKTECF